MFVTRLLEQVHAIVAGLIGVDILFHFVAAEF